nr:hypothetical protein [Tanacetum cinerariifolium]
MVRLCWLLWPQPATSPPQRWRQTAELSEAPLGVAPPQHDTTWCGCGGCTTRNREFHKLHRGGGGQSTTHSPTTATAAAGKAAAVVVVPVVVVDSCEAAAVGVVGGAWRQWMVYRWWWSGASAEGGGSKGDEVDRGCHGGEERRCMASVGGRSYRSGYRKHFWGLPENFSGGGSRRRPAGDGGGWPAAGWWGGRE